MIVFFRKLFPIYKSEHAQILNSAYFFVENLLFPSRKVCGQLIQTCKQSRKTSLTKHRYLLFVICIDFCPHLFAQRRYPARLARSFWHTFCDFIGLCSALSMDGTFDTQIFAAPTSLQLTNQPSTSLFTSRALSSPFSTSNFKFHLSVPFMKYSNPRHSFTTICANKDSSFLAFLCALK